MSVGTVTFANVSLMTRELGVFEPKPGMFERKKSYPFLPRAGVLTKDLGRGAATHTVKLTYTNVAPADIQDVRDMLIALYDPLSGSPTVGQLEFRTQNGIYGRYSHCVLDSCEEGEMMRRTEGVTPGNPNGVECYDLEFNLKFVQTRRG